MHKIRITPDVDSCCFQDQEAWAILASHAYIYILTFANIAHIRAVGDLYAIYIGDDWRSALKVRKQDKLLRFLLHS